MKKDIILYYKNMLNKYAHNNIVNNKDKNDLLKLIKYHPNYYIKIGKGIKDFIVKHNRYGSICFNIIRIDNTKDDFSFYKCIRNMSKLEAHNFLQGTEGTILSSKTYI